MGENNQDYFWYQKSWFLAVDIPEHAVQKALEILELKSLRLFYVRDAPQVTKEHIVDIR